MTVFFIDQLPFMSLSQLSHSTEGWSTCMPTCSGNGKFYIYCQIMQCTLYHGSGKPIIQYRSFSLPDLSDMAAFVIKSQKMCSIEVDLSWLNVVEISAMECFCGRILGHWRSDVQFKSSVFINCGQQRPSSCGSAWESSGCYRQWGID